MTNADKFKNIFGLYATELWSMPEKDFLKWLNSEAMNCSEFPNNSDTISRQAAIDLAKDLIIPSESFHQYNQGVSNYCAELVKLQPAEPPYDPNEWCHDCKEYDQERHSCPRWNRVIRKTVDELRAEQAGRREE